MADSFLGGGKWAEEPPPNMRPPEGTWVPDPQNYYHETIHWGAIVGDPDYVRGNVRLSQGGHSTEHITDPDVADAIHTGRRDQRHGLVYHAGFSGFEPALWPHVIGPPLRPGEPSRHIAYLGADSGGYRMLFVKYADKVDGRLWDCTKTVLKEHKGVRADDECSGRMVGGGDHLRRDGFTGRFAVAGRGGLVRKLRRPELRPSPKGPCTRAGRPRGKPRGSPPSRMAPTSRR